MRVVILLILIIFSFSSCVVEKGEVRVSLNKKSNSDSKSSSTSKAFVSSVKIINHQLIVTGTGLSNIENVKINGQSFAETFTIESKSATQIIANSIRALSFDVSKVFDLVLSSANASATFQIDFNLCNANLYGKGFDCVGTSTIHDKDVLMYDSGKNAWIPRSLSNFSYQGTLDASGVMPSAGASGEYFIISVAGNGFTVGDWAVSNGTNFDKIDNSTSVTKVFNRLGDVVPVEGDYDLNMLADVTLGALTGADTGKILKYNGTQWVLSDDLTGGGAASVVTASIANSAVTDAKIDTVSASKITGTINSTQILDGTIVNADINAAAAIDYSKLNIPNTTIPYAKLNIADGDIPATKISGLPAATAVIAASIVDGDTTHAPDGNSVFDALAAKMGLTGGTLSTGTINGVPTPVSGDDVVNKDYVDDQDALLLLKTGGTISGVLTVDDDLKLKGDAAGYVTLKGHPTSVDYNFVFPVNAGTGGYVLQTDGSGNTSWVDPSTVTSGVGTVNSGSIVDGSIMNTDVNASAAIDYSKLNVPDAAIPLVKLAGAVDSTKYLRGDKTWATLDTLAVPENTNLYFTDARARTASVADAIADAVLNIAPSQNAVFDALATKLNLTGGTLSVGTISGVPTPTNADDVANKGYVDGYGQWIKSGSDIYRSGGYVGIGTTTPGRRLDLYAPAGSTSPFAIRTNDYVTGTTGSALFVDFGAASGNTYSQISAASAGGSATNNLVLQGSGGNVGIGTASPGLSGGVGRGYLTISGTTSRGVLQLTSQEADADGAGIGQIEWNDSHSTNTSSRVAYIAGFLSGTTPGKRGSYLSFATKPDNDANAAFERMMIASNGNVGIGTSAPNNILAIGTDLGAMVVPASSVTIGNTTASSLFTLGQDSTNRGRVRWTYNATPANAHMAIGTNAGQPLVLQDIAGNVGIGLTNPSYLLHVNGLVAGVGAYVNASDARYKKDITPVKSSLDRLTSIEGVYYNWKQDEFPEMNFGNKREMGVIAQKVEHVFPEAVSKDKKGFRSVAYSMLIAPIIESIKEIKNWLIGHDKALEANRREIASLKQAVEEQKEQNAAMRSYLCSRDSKAPFCVKNQKILK